MCTCFLFLPLLLNTLFTSIWPYWWLSSSLPVLSGYEEVTDALIRCTQPPIWIKPRRDHRSGGVRNGSLVDLEWIPGALLPGLPATTSLRLLFFFSLHCRATTTAWKRGGKRRRRHGNRGCRGESMDISVTLPWNGWWSLPRAESAGWRGCSGGGQVFSLSPPEKSSSRLEYSCLSFVVLLDLWGGGDDGESQYLIAVWLLLKWAGACLAAATAAFVDTELLSLTGH